MAAVAVVAVALDEVALVAVVLVVLVVVLVFVLVLVFAAVFLAAAVRLLAVVVAMVKIYREGALKLGVALWADPGRFFCGDACRCL